MKKIILIIAMLVGASAYSGQDGGGGTSLAAEFVYVGQNALQILSKELPNVDLSKSEDILKNTEVFDVGNICYKKTDGSTFCRDAEYSAIEQKISFDRARWTTKTCVEKLVISSHEYLRAGGLEDANYYYSSKFYGTNLSVESRKKIDDVCAYLIKLKEERLKELLTCESKAQLIGNYILSLPESMPNGETPNDPLYQARLSAELRSSFGSWKNSYANCVEEGRKVCIETCMAIGGTVCFSGCN